ncbi:MAG TPA: guanylate kinase [Thermoleophilia bacterium]|nr:guanylate kinase [Thermoleophilia bacterium]
MPSVFVVSGPSGAGKGTVISLVREALPDVVTSVSATTRAPRPGEADGRHYRFLSTPQFRREIEAGNFLEWVDYGGNLYGTLRADVDAKLAQGYDVILEIELQGARAIRRAMPDATLIFVAPPSATELARRLQGRATDSAAAIARRLEIAKAEIAAEHEFDVVVVNDEARRAAAEIIAVIAQRRDDETRHKGD